LEQSPSHLHRKPCDICRCRERNLSCRFLGRRIDHVDNLAVPAEARKVIADGRAKLNQLLRANVAFEKPKMDVNSLCELISAFFSGICIEANLNPDRKRARRKIRDFMQMLRAA